MFNDLKAFCSADDDFIYIRRAITALVDAKPLDVNVNGKNNNGSGSGGGGQEDGGSLSSKSLGGGGNGVGEMGSGGAKGRTGVDGKGVQQLPSCIPFIGELLFSLLLLLFLLRFVFASFYSSFYFYICFTSLYVTLSFLVISDGSDGIGGRVLLIGRAVIGYAMIRRLAVIDSPSFCDGCFLPRRFSSLSFNPIFTLLIKKSLS